MNTNLPLERKVRIHGACETIDITAYHCSLHCTPGSSSLPNSFPVPFAQPVVFRAFRKAKLFILF
ncbi:MAG: hypothetical protein KDE58_16330, partial [Caldilineaceae bacterium]|nr:hypothetical protein [Caldilineaceae bacterium]